MRQGLRLVATVVALSGAVCPSAGASAPGAEQVARGGFGDPRNSYAWSMAWFKGRLYVGTARSAMCVEAATIDFYRPGLGFYRRHPAPGVDCPASIDDADLRAEIWRYDPGTGRWARVYRSRRVRNPRAPGRLVARDIGYRGMAVLEGRDGSKALYVGALSPDEYLPKLARRYPPRLLRTADGRRFRAVGRGPGVIRTPAGPRRPVGFRALTTVGGRLYVTASAGLTGDGVVLRVRHPGTAAARFRQVSPRTLSVFELASFRGSLYAGTGDPTGGYGVWRDAGGRWVPVMTGGAGRGSAITSVVSMAPYRGHLYVGASGWGTTAYPPSELIRLDRAGRWDLVVGNPRPDASGVLRRPLSGLPDGFGNAFNSHFWRMTTFRGALVLGTNDWSWSVRAAPEIVDRLRPGMGFDLYATCDGSAWTRVTQDGFGHGPDDFGVRTMVPTPAGLFVGSTNLVDGTSIYRLRRVPAPDDRRARCP